MKLLRHKNFRKNFKKRISHNKKLVKKFEERVSIFIKDPGNPLLKDHQLTGELKDYRAFWVGGDIRVVYKVKGDDLELYDIGSHNQVY